MKWFLSPCFVYALSYIRICYKYVIQKTAWVSPLFYFYFYIFVLFLYFILFSPNSILKDFRARDCAVIAVQHLLCAVNILYVPAAIVTVPLTMGNPGTRGRGGCYRAPLYCCKSLICRPNETREEPRVSGAPCFLQGFMLSEQSVYFVSGNLTTNQVLPEVYIWTQSLFHFWPIYGVWFIVVLKSHVFSLPPPILLHCFWCSNQCYWVIKSSLSSCPPRIPFFFFYAFYCSSHLNEHFNQFSPSA